MIERAGDVIEHPEQAVVAESLAAKFSASADDLITRAFAVRQHFNHNVDENGVGIHVFSTNDTGSSGKGGDILVAGQLDDIPSQSWRKLRITRERKQLTKDEEGPGPLGPIPEDEEKNGRLGPLTGAYTFAEFTHDPRIGSDHVDGGYNWIEAFGKPSLRPARDGSLEAAAASTETKLDAIREIVEAAEVRYAATTALKRDKTLPKLISWIRGKLPFTQ